MSKWQTELEQRRRAAASRPEGVGKVSARAEAESQSCLEAWSGRGAACRRSARPGERSGRSE